MLNDFETRGRAEKAAAIVEQVEQRCVAIGLTPQGDAAQIVELLGQLTDSEWAELQQSAGYSRKEPPSAKTRDLVIATFKGRIDPQ